MKCVKSCVLRTHNWLRSRRKIFRYEIVKSVKNVAVVLVGATLRTISIKIKCVNNLKKVLSTKTVDRIRVTRRIDAEPRVKPCHGTRSAVDRRENPFRSDLICQDHSYSV